MKLWLIFGLIMSVFILPNTVSAYVILSEDKCGLTDCCSIVNIVNHTTQELNQLKNTALSDLNVKRGEINFNGITIQNSSSVKICGKINAGSSNYWGIGTIWNSTWWNSSYPYRYPIYTYRNNLSQIFSVNDTSQVFNRDIIWINTSNNTAYVYCVNQYCSSNAYAIGTEQQIAWENETTMSGYNRTEVYDSYYRLVLHLSNSSTLDSTKYNKTVQSSNVFETDNNNTGKFGKGLTMNSTLSTYRLNVSEVNSGNPFTSFTLELWFYTNAPQTAQYIFRGKTKDGSFQVDIGETTTNKTTCQVLDAGTAWRSSGASSTTILPRTWYYYACEWNGSHINQYLNGVWESAGACASIKNAETGGTSILSGTTDKWLLGKADEIRISNISRGRGQSDTRYYSDQYGNGIDLYTYFLGEETFTIPTLHMALNGTEGNYTANCSSAVNFTVWWTTNDGKNFTNTFVAYYHNTSTPVSNTSPPYTAITSYSANTTAFNWTAYYAGNETYSSQLITRFMDVVNCSIPPIVYNYTNVEKTYCNGSILKTEFKYNEITDSYYNYSKNCTYGCDSDLNICKPSSFVLYIIVFIAFILFIVTIGIIRRFI